MKLKKSNFSDITWCEEYYSTKKGTSFFHNKISSQSRWEFPVLDSYLELKFLDYLRDQIEWFYVRPEFKA